MVFIIMLNFINLLYREEKQGSERGYPSSGAEIGGRLEHLSHASPLGIRAVANRAVVICVILRLHWADGQDASIVGCILGS